MKSREISSGELKAKLEAGDVLEIVDIRETDAYHELLLSGDTLFVDAVGRPDLEHGDHGADSLARTLYASGSTSRPAPTAAPQADGMGLTHASASRPS